ncbi:MAG: 2,3-bisphosphoglycerate-independent phosphoglycerate mutase [Gaiellales bacterium]|jgi:2,3-bisphosphoglycerate-independent phosphoglycerate mutase|nr:2,3-bisphosphoglycerate-independent phosphoglycerate mutase [Gaiellales bacterium]
MTQPVVLVVLDGFGLAPAGPGNAVALARTPVFDALWERRSHTTLTASGLAVGLPEGQMGNSEVGHLNIGAGRIVAQDLVRIDNAVADGSLAANPALQAAFAAARDGRGVLHLAGLVSDGGVHSHVDHLRAIVGAALGCGVPRVSVHAFTDGRDVSPHQAAGLLAQLEREWAGGPSEFATVVGRYYAMDRDHRLERTELARAAIVDGVGEHAGSASAAVEGSYAAGLTDEFIKPIVLGDAGLRVAQGDPLVFFNFRPDRARQMSHALAPALGLLVTMTRYDDTLGARVAFDNVPLQGTLADVLEAAGVRQLHVAETEKYAHVTYFFDGGREQRHDGEDWELVSSRRDVPTYDFAPEMSAAGVAQRLAERLPDGYGFAIVNLANPDMVGHSGVLPAVITAVEASDEALGVILAAVERAGGAALVTADHGNAEQMLEPDGSPHTAHTTNPVPLVCTLAAARLRDGGKLGDLAPTVLALLGIAPSPEMTGESLLL